MAHFPLFATLLLKLNRKSFFFIILLFSDFRLRHFILFHFIFMWSLCFFFLSSSSAFVTISFVLQKQKKKGSKPFYSLKTVFFGLFLCCILLWKINFCRIFSRFVLFCVCLFEFILFLFFFCCIVLCVWPSFFFSNSIDF